MGTVYAAVDESTGQRVALKRLGSSAAAGTRRKSDGGVRDAAILFQLEYTMLARLVHPSLIEVYEYGVDGGVPYYTMELLDGRDLREIAPVPYREACRFVRDVASSLALLHAHRLVHRDVSPRNVRVTRDGRAKLLDFGTLTPFGVPPDIAGTPPCVPPEGLNGGAVDDRSDLYSLGAVLYWLITGKDAFSARRLDELPALLERAVVPPSALAPTVPPALDSLVLTMLSRNPLARPKSAAEVIERLDAIARLPPEERGEIAQAYFLSARTVGRSAQIGSVERNLDRALSGTGGSVLVVAERGFGKTRFCREIAVSAQTRGATVVVVEGSSEDGPFGTVRAIAARILQISQDDAVATAEPYAAHLCHAVPELVSRLGEVVPSGLERAPGEFRARVVAALRAWFCDFAARRPLVIVVDDVDHADESSQEVVASLSKPWNGSRLLVLATAENKDAVPGGNAFGVRLRLGPLGGEDVVSLVGSLFGGAPNTRRLARRIHQLSAGSPRGVMDLLRHFVQKKQVRYAGGIWMLPEEAPADALPESVEEARKARLAGLAPRARAFAEALSIAGTALPVHLCLTLAAADGEPDSARALGLLDELVTEGVLAGSGGRYRFAEEPLRESLAQSVDEARRSKIHLSLGNALATIQGGTTFDAVLAGHHLLRGGAEERGAELLAGAGQKLLLETDDLRAAVPALEAALVVFQRLGKPAHELAPIIGPLAMAAFFVDRKLAARYGPGALALLREATGLAHAEELRPKLGGVLSLGAGVASAAVARRANTGEGASPSTRELFEMLLRTSMTLSGVAGVCLDAEGVEEVLSALSPLSVLSDNHGASWVRAHCEGIRAMCVGAVGGAAQMLGRTLRALEGQEQPSAYPEGARRLFVGGTIFALGAMACLSDEGAALDYADRLERLDLRLYDLVATQLRMLHHAHQGDAELARMEHERLETLVVDRGSAWQTEVWEAPSMLLVHLRDGDVLGLRGDVERLGRLAREIPSLEPFALLARAAHTRARGRLDEAAGLLHSLVGPNARPFLGRGPAVGLSAEVFNALGAHSHAEACTRAFLLSQSTEDRRFGRLSLGVKIQHAFAIAALGDRAEAELELDLCLDALTESCSRLSLGMVHEARARIALAAGDSGVFNAHLQKMEKYLRPTDNPSLIAACERLRHEGRVSRKARPERSSDPFGLRRQSPN